MRGVGLLAALAALAALASPVAADPRALTLHDALALAISRNPELAAARIAVVDADGQELHARGQYDATLELHADGHSERHDPRALPFAQELQRDQLETSATVSKAFEDGTKVALRVGGSKAIATSRLPLGTAGSLDDKVTTVTPTLDARVDEPLLGGRRAGSAEVAALHARRAAAGFDELATAEQVVRDVEQGYWQLCLAQRAVAIHAHAVELAEAQLRVVRAEISRGARPALAAAEVEEELARRKEDHLVARGERAERSIALAALLGLPPELELAASEEPPDVAPAAPAEILRSALAHSPKLRAAIARGDAAASDLVKAEDGARWRVDAYLLGSMSSPADRMRDALARTAGYGGWMIEAGVTVRIPLGEAAARGAIDSARAALVEARIGTSDVEAQVAARATRAANHLALACQRRTALAHSVELAQQNLDAEQHRWERGDTTSFELLRRQTALADTQLRAERAVVDELSALAEVDSLTGTLLARHHITVE